MYLSSDGLCDLGQVASRQSAFSTEDATYSLRLIWRLKLGKCMEYTHTKQWYIIFLLKGFGGGERDEVLKVSKGQLKTITTVHWALRQEKSMHSKYIWSAQTFLYRDLFQYLFKMVKNKQTNPRPITQCFKTIEKTDRDLYSHMVKCQAVIKKMYLEEYWRHAFLKGGKLVLRRLKES